MTARAKTNMKLAGIVLGAAAILIGGILTGARMSFSSGSQYEAMKSNDATHDTRLNGQEKQLSDVKASQRAHHDDIAGLRSDIAGLRSDTKNMSENVKRILNKLEK